MGLRLQAKLLKELYGLIPDNCQLWIATHSIGMMRAAYDLGQENPGAVVFLDFDKRDFDQTEVITPSKVNRTAWEIMHRVVLEDLVRSFLPLTRSFFAKESMGRKRAGRAVLQYNLQ